MTVRVCRFAAIMLAAFSLSLSMTHLLELPQRMQFDQELWVRVTVFEGVYKYFGIVGSMFELGAIVAAFLLTYLLRGRGPTFYWALAGALLLLIAFSSWVVFVNSANAELARWLNSPIPTDWTKTRNQWEYAHAINAFIKVGGFGLLVISTLTELPNGNRKRQATGRSIYVDNQWRQG